jgi:flagellar motor switch protein FliN/FliY
MSRTIQQLLTLEVPVIVRVGTTKLSVAEITALAPGSIIEIDKPADEELDLLVNNRHVGFGVAVKVGENFGVELTYLGDPLKRHLEPGKAHAPTEAELSAMADAMLAGLR